MTGASCRCKRSHRLTRSSCQLAVALKLNDKEKEEKHVRRASLLAAFDPSSLNWDRALLTVNGKLIERVTASFKRQLDIEGSARLRDGRIVNFHQKTDGRWFYMEAPNAPFGLGLDGYKLIPYRTLAVDPEVIRPGTVLYLPALDGVPLPSGEIHDGFMFAHDRRSGHHGQAY
jgi:hypothetical protein